MRVAWDESAFDLGRGRVRALQFADLELLRDSRVVKREVVLCFVTVAG